MQIHIYSRDDAGIIEYLGWQGWDSLDEFREHCGLEQHQAEDETLTGWPTSSVTWYGRTGVAVEEEDMTLTAAQNLIGGSSNLDELLINLERALAELDPQDAKNFDITSLPTFGGPEPRDTTAIWSWDETRLLVGVGDFEIRDRETEE